jgi:dTDP-4-dehydrorhamnose 3,5-epimerase
MKFTETTIPGLWIIDPAVLGDNRGYFMEAYRQDLFEAHVGRVHFVQDNESGSSKGVLRGLHYQLPPRQQAKLVRVIRGAVLDVAVDMRRQSPTFGKHIAVELSGENKRQMFIPRGFAHGFHVLSDEAVFTYKVDNPYSPAHERGFRFDDPDIGIDWKIAPGMAPLVSAKDAGLPRFGDAEICF